MFQMAPELRPARRMVRFRPETHQLEYLASGTQFGHSFDTWGHQFTVSNEDHIREEVIAASYLVRNPQLSAATAMERISDHGAAADGLPDRAQSARGDAERRRARSPRHAPLRFISVAHFPSFGLFSLTAEPAQNLVHRDVLRPSGASYTAARAARERGVPGFDGRLVPARQLVHRTGWRDLSARLLPPGN